MSSFLNDLPCRNPESFSRFHAPGAVRQTSVRPTYTAKLDANAKEIINDSVPLLIHRLSQLPKDESRKRSMPDDESEVPSFSLEQSKRSKQTISNNSSQVQRSNTIDCDDEFS
ncbi:hypothetical protein I4U23_007614 [Adineta vaga]|nr:hypothetical protein I4U23_007614 [Adineta vaga]